MDHEVETALKDLNSGWVGLEVEGAEFGDKRLSARYAQVLESMSKLPKSPFTQTSEDLAEMLGAYRFIANKKVTVEKLLEPHREQLAKRAAGESRVLLIQDTTYFDMSDHRRCDDLKPSGLVAMKKALWAHCTLCILPNGLPLGVVDAQFSSGKLGGATSGERVQKRPVEEKQTGRWLRAVDNCRDVFDPSQQKIWLSDRETDFYEYIEHVSRANEDFVIRSHRFREIEEPPFFGMRQRLGFSPVKGCYFFNVSSSNGKKARTAKMEVKFVSVTISVPPHRTDFAPGKSVKAFVVECAEIDPPMDAEPVYWRLLTSLQVTCLEEAMEIVSLYQKRWAIEEFFRVLKSGCRSEEAQFQTTERIAKYIVLSMLVAWRLYSLVHVNRLDPDAPASFVLTVNELEALQLLVDDKRGRKQGKRRFVIHTARQALNEISKLGGFLDRKKFPHPGVVVLWRGFTTLAHSSNALQAFKRSANA